MSTPTSDDVPHRRRRAAVAGHTGDDATARRLADDPDPSVRSTALGALARLGALTSDHLRRALDDDDPRVRRRVIELAARPTDRTPEDRDAVLRALADALGDADDRVAEVAAWAIGECAGIDPVTAEPAASLPDGLLEALGTVAARHADPLCREAAVAALGALGRDEALDLVLAATTDKPAVRRRAVIALAAFVDDERALAALRAAMADRDWQVREAAEILLDGLDGPGAESGVTP